MELIRALAEYERLSHEVVASAPDLAAALFGRRRVAEAALAEIDGEAVGFALFFHTYSTFVGKPGLYLEDLFVKPGHRRRGVGRALLRHLAALAVARGCGRFEWTALDWNKPALAFYQSLGAIPLAEWIIFRMSGEPLARLGARTGLTGRRWPTSRQRRRAPSPRR
jgi:GNAT superfamily N-acetyltransferase